jgi:Cft2 family RNA processing exonuclease
MPPRHETVDQLLTIVKDALAAGRTPVIHAYPLGKSQEATCILTRAGISVLQHPTIFAISETYRECGVDLGDVRAFRPDLVPGRAVLTLPKGARDFRLRGLIQPVSIAVTGWALDASTKYRWDVDHALPLSDHADFDELMQTAAIVGASEIYCVHGPRDFVAHLRAAGFNASPMHGSYQTRMF